MTDAVLLAGARIALVGNPNCGKTALFNALTGGRAKVANYPGVTVERKEGSLTSPAGRPIQTTRDLPGFWAGSWADVAREMRGRYQMVTDAGEEILRPGDCAAFKAGDRDGHHLINKSDRDVLVLEVGNASPDDVCDYPDIDMTAGPGPGYRHRDGRLYPVKS